MPEVYLCRIALARFVARLRRSDRVWPESGDSDSRDRVTNFCGYCSRHRAKCRCRAITGYDAARVSDW